MPQIVWTRSAFAAARYSGTTRLRDATPAASYPKIDELVISITSSFEAPPPLPSEINNGSMSTKQPFSEMLQVHDPEGTKRR